MKTPDWIGLLEACYDISQPDRATWLRGVLDHAFPLFRHGLQLGVVTVSCTPGTLKVVDVLDAGPPQWSEWSRAMLAQAPPGFLDRVFRGPPIRSYSQDLFPKFPGMHEETLRSSEGKVQDVLGVVGHTGDGDVVALAALSAMPVTPTALERSRWPRAAAHLGAGFRLRRALGNALDSPQVDAVLDPSGRMRDAKPAANSVRTRHHLSRAVQLVDRARTRAGRLDVAASMQAWQGLIEGRWSLVDHFDSDGTRFVLAVKNAPEHRDPRGLTARERQCAEFVGLGQSTKVIAYTLGISEAAVTGSVTAARLKLGLRSRSELAAFFSPSGARARLAELCMGSHRLLVGAYPLCDERSIRELTPAERDIVVHLLRGSTNQDIAKRRNSSPRTIANQVQSIFRKLGVQSRVELATRIQSQA